MYKNFEYSLQQIACETTNSAQYSLVRTCDDCAAAYKQWLCSVTIPRCTDFSSTLSWLQERNIGQAYPNGTQLDPATLASAQNILYLNSSRNPNIDSVVQPGPYKEVLPCTDLCSSIVQSCPSAMGFGCPQRGGIGYNTSYGDRPDDSAEQDGQITCNYPGAAYFLSAGHELRPGIATLAVMVAVCISML
jgi:calcium channel MID1